jgi:YidC/Oxa1 family membrane protein insertase
VQFYSDDQGGANFAFGYKTLSPARLAPGDKTVLKTRFYAGPKEHHRLEQAAEGLVLTVDYGWLTFIAAPLFWVLEWLHKLVNNWGWAIILLTILIKILFYPLSVASYRSMAQMKKLQPRIQQLKERYKDDRQKFQQAMMEVYKTEKINPLGGCLPILIQIPVFIALYWVLLESVELRLAPWALWIKDLSSPDPYFVLPILMGATMLAQQWLNPQPLDDLQKKVMYALPVVFTFMFLFFPSGLVLYWVVQNILSIAQQWQITRAVEGKK